jgi:hypothetical protein
LWLALAVRLVRAVLRRLRAARAAERPEPVARQLSRLVLAQTAMRPVVSLQWLAVLVRERAQAVRLLSRAALQVRARPETAERPASSVVRLSARQAMAVQSR